MKKIFLFAAIAALFAACSSKDELVKDDSTQQPQLEKGAIGFDAYTQKATTRGGWAGSLTTAMLQDNLNAKCENGFGVFGFYTDNNEYEQRSVPNFMYNQQVTYDAGSWVYYPIMYWPNEYGSNATSDDQDKVTFFAYAPYVKVIPTSGKLARTTTDPDPDDTKTLESYGITSMTRNSAQGDPILKYIASFNHNRSVDLCWGVADNNDGKKWGLTQTGMAQNPGIENGTPWLNLERPANTDQRVKFTFKHALAQLQVNIDADVDVDGRGHEKVVAPKTRVWVRSVTLKGFAMKGALNLNNETANKPKWLDYGGQNEIVSEDVIVYDGREDGKEGVNGAVATNEKSLGLNPRIVQDGVYALTDGEDVYKSSALKVIGVDKNGTTVPSIAADVADYTRDGVTNTPVPLFCQNLDNKNDAAGTGNVFHVIPTDDNFDIEIVYDIETVDQNLAQNLSDGATKGSSIENRISKEISFGTNTTGLVRKLEAGHSYKLNLHLGLNSVKFDAAVVDWIDEPKQDVDLPLNIPAFEQGTTPNPTVLLSHAVADYSFAITGLDGGESVAVTGNTLTWSTTNAEANANQSGVAIEKITTTVNSKTIDRTNQITWTGNQSGKSLTIDFTQAAHPLFLTVEGVANNSSNQGEITLKRWNNEKHDAITDWGSEATGWLCGIDGTAISAPSDQIKVWRNGVPLEFASSVSGGKFTFSDTGDTDQTNKITLGDKLQPGDVIRIELTTGNAPTETVTAKIGSFSFPAPSLAKAKGETFPYPLDITGEATIKYEKAWNFTSSTVNIDNGDVTTGLTTGVRGTDLIKATVTPKNGWFYLEEKATYLLSVGDVVFPNGGSYTPTAYGSASEEHIIYICGLTKNGTLAVSHNASDTGIISYDSTDDEPAIFAGVTGSTSNKADDWGVAYIKFKPLANSTGGDLTDDIIVTDNGQTMTIHIIQGHP